MSIVAGYARGVEENPGGTLKKATKLAERAAKERSSESRSSEKAVREGGWVLGRGY